MADESNQPPYQASAKWHPPNWGGDTVKVQRVVCTRPIPRTLGPRRGLSLSFPTKKATTPSCCPSISRAHRAKSAGPSLEEWRTGRTRPTIGRAVRPAGAVIAIRARPLWPPWTSSAQRGPSQLSCHCVVYRQHLIDAGIRSDFKRASTKAYTGTANRTWGAH